MEKPTVFITGATGLLGHYLIESLLNSGTHKIFTLSRSRKDQLDQKYRGKSVMNFSVGELRNGNFPIREIDTVIHCAFTIHQEGDKLVESLNLTNELLAIFNCDFINISSKSVYGQSPDTPWKEDVLPHPKTKYGIAKYASEKMVEIKYQAQDLSNFTNIRLGSLLAPEFGMRVVNKLIDQVVQKKRIKIIGGNQLFAYFDIRDAAEGIEILLNTSSKKWRPTYNLGYKKAFTLLEIAETIQKVSSDFGLETQIQHVEKSIDHVPAEMDSSLFFKDMDWQPQNGMEQMVKNIFNYKLNK